MGHPFGSILIGSTLLVPLQLLLVPQCLSRLERELNSLLGFLLAAERFEAFALKVEDVLLAHWSARSDVAAAEDFGDLAA